MEQLDRPFHRRFLSPGSDSDADTGSGGALVEEQPGHTAGDAVIPLQQLDCQPQKDWTDSDHRKRENTPHDRACCRLSVSCSLTLLSTPLQGGGAAGGNGGGEAAAANVDARGAIGRKARDAGAEVDPLQAKRDKEAWEEVRCTLRPPPLRAVTRDLGSACAGDITAVAFLGAAACVRCS